MELLPLVGLPLALVVVFVWRNDALTGVVGVILGVFCTAWLLRAIEAIDSQQMWSASTIPRTYYYVLAWACGIAAVTSAYYVVKGLIHYVWSRRRARLVALDPPRQPPATATRACPHCGARIPAQAIACKYCARDVHQRG